MNENWLQCWVHCNKCWKKYNNDPKIHVTSCGHMLCNSCVAGMGSSSKCRKCNANCQAIMISSEMPPDALEFFKNPLETIEKFKQVVQFQFNNINSLFNTNNKKYDIAKAEIGRNLRIIEGQKKEIERLKAMLKQQELNSRANYSASPASIGVSPMAPHVRLSAQNSIPLTPFNHRSGFMQWNPNSKMPSVRSNTSKTSGLRSQYSYTGSQEPSFSEASLSSNRRFAQCHNAALASMSNVHLGHIKKTH